MKEKVTILTMAILFIIGLCMTPYALASCMDNCHQHCGSSYPNNIDHYNACMNGCGRWCDNPPN